MKGLSPEQIAAVMGKSRSQKGFYGVALAEFNESDEAAIVPREVWPVELAEKTTSTIYQGFRNAAKAAKIECGPGGTLSISMSDDEVFILHNARVAAVMTPQADTATEENTNPSEVTTTVVTELEQLAA